MDIEDMIRIFVLIILVVITIYEKIKKYKKSCQDSKIRMEFQRKQEEKLKNLKEECGENVSEYQEQEYKKMI